MTNNSLHLDIKKFYRSLSKEEIKQAIESRYKEQLKTYKAMMDSIIKIDTEPKVKEVLYYVIDGERVYPKFNLL